MQKASVPFSMPLAETRVLLGLFKDLFHAAALRHLQNQHMCMRGGVSWVQMHIILIRHSSPLHLLLQGWE